jgi:UDP-N-acetylglucosamine 4,6-dehydratase
MIGTLATRFGYDPSDIQIETVGKRVGETLHEHIMTEREADRALENDGLLAIPPEAAGGREDYLSFDGIRDFDPAPHVVRSSANAEKLDPEEIKTLLEDNGVLEVVQ